MKRLIACLLLIGMFFGVIPASTLAVGIDSLTGPVRDTLSSSTEPEETAPTPAWEDSSAETTSTDTVSGVGIPTGEGIEANSGKWHFFLDDETVESTAGTYGGKTGGYYDGDAMRDVVFSEHLGLWLEATMDYALWIPDSYYENPDGRFALVTTNPVSQRDLVHPADLTPVGFSSPETRANPAYYSSDAAAEVVEDAHGLDGIFVVVPTITNAGRVQDDATLPSQYSLMLLLYDALIENYPIDTDHIYGCGESVGGMVLPQINTHRDNFFAGIVIHGSQWYSNFYKDTVWNTSMLSGSGMSANPARLERHYTLTDDRIIWDYDSGGEYDWLAWQNVYYMTSNSNLLALSTHSAWDEWSAVISSLTGYDFARISSTDNGADLLQQMADADNTYNGVEMGLWLVDGIMGTGYDTNPGVGNAYVGEWLLRQTRPTSEERPKLDINKPFAGTEGTAETSTSSGYTGQYHYEDIGDYYWVADSSAGTLFYNSIMFRPPGWLPSTQNTSVSDSDSATELGALLEHPVAAASIQSVTKVSSDGSTLIVALEYDTDMENAVIYRVNDQVQSEYYFVDTPANENGFSQSSYPRADFVVMDTFDFYDENGTKLNEPYDVVIGNDNPEYILNMESMLSKIYINDAPEAIADAGDRTGSGNYVIVEIETSADPDTISVIQRAPIVAPEGNALASANYRMVTSTAAPAEPVDAADAIEGIHAIGFMDTDGAKLNAIAVEYNVDLTGADVDADTYALDVWSTSLGSSGFNNGGGEIGDILAVYVNDEADTSEAGGSGTGNYVIIEVYTDYQYSSEQTFTRAMGAGITQNGDIVADGITVIGDGTTVTNYTGSSGSRSATYGTYTIKGVEGFQYYTNLTDSAYPVHGEAFVAEDCFNEQDGEYYTVAVSYALYLPEDYDPDGSYAMVTLQNPAASESTHPMESVLTTRSPAVFASDWAQELVRDTHGLDGLIVVVPVVTQRVNDNAGTPAEYPAIVKLWDYIQEEYAVDGNYVYGAGQSVGGMILMETNRNRDNYFAGIMMYENQWAQNYYKDEVFARGMSASNWDETPENTTRHYPRTDGTITWDYHWDNSGQKDYDNHDPDNYYYLVSDDNILIMNSTTNYLSNNTWQEMSYLYSDLAGYEMSRVFVDANADLAVQEQTVADYLAASEAYNGQEMGIKWVSFDSGINGYSARRVDAGYEWLLTRTGQSTIERDKLDLNKPFELADEQDMTRVMPNFVDPDTGGTIYYLTGKAGSGTQFYNTCWLRTGSNVTADRIPGWLPDGMSHPVSAAAIEGVTPILNGDGVLTAAAVQYSEDMEDAVVHIIGDSVIDSKGNPRNDDFVTVDPFQFYDESGEPISATITNVYANSEPAAVSGAARGSGSGSYLIVELDTDWTGTSIGLVQRTTVRTNTAIASASAKLYSGEAAEVAVEDVVIDGLVLQSVAVGKTLQLSATVTPANATNQNLTWTSTNPNYATVEDGVVTGVAPGTVIITATADNGVSYSMRVKVTAF